MRSTFLLVHGAWHGGWCWRRVEDRLRARGARVYAPTLTGLADRDHLATPEVGLATHIADVVRLAEVERLSEVVLVGHSYGGMVATGACEHLEGRLRAIVMLDAFVPAADQSMLDVSPRSAGMVEAAGAKGEWKLPPIPAAAFKVNEADRAWVDAQCTPQPIVTFTEPVSASAVAARDRLQAKAYIRATATDSPWFDSALAHARSAGWRTWEVPCGHDVMLDLPDRLTEILLEVA